MTSQLIQLYFYIDNTKFKRNTQFYIQIFHAAQII